MTKMVNWHGLLIPDNDCFLVGKKCTPSCPHFDMAWLHQEKDEESV